MAKVLVVVDMQNDFLTGALKNDEGVKVIPHIKGKLENAGKDTLVCFTRDTHFEDYLETEEGKNLPVVHCIYGTEGWQITDELNPLKDGKALPANTFVFDKYTFGSRQFASFLSENSARIDEIELVGVCTDICVISNAMLAKATLPNIPVYVDAAGCAGVTPATHDNAIEAMKMCHIHIVNEKREAWR